jgi:hypothetical protein
MKTLLYVVSICAVISASVYIQWWRCGEMFPHAQFACFIGSGK